MELPDSVQRELEEFLDFDIANFCETFEQPKPSSPSSIAQDLAMASIELKLREGHDVLFRDCQAKFLNWTVENPTFAESSGALLIFNLINNVKEDVQFLRRGVATLIAAVENRNLEIDYAKRKKPADSKRKSPNSGSRSSSRKIK